MNIYEAGSALDFIISYLGESYSGLINSFCYDTVL